MFLSQWIRHSVGKPKIFNVMDITWKMKHFAPNITFGKLHSSFWSIKSQHSAQELPAARINITRADMELFNCFQYSAATDFTNIQMSHVPVYSYYVGKFEVAVMSF